MVFFQVEDIEHQQALVREVHANLTSKDGPVNGLPTLDMPLEKFQDWVGLVHSYMFQTFGEVRSVRRKEGIALMQVG